MASRARSLPSWATSSSGGTRMKSASRGRVRKSTAAASASHRASPNALLGTVRHRQEPGRAEGAAPLATGEPLDELGGAIGVARDHDCGVVANVRLRVVRDGQLTNVLSGRTHVCGVDDPRVGLAERHLAEHAFYVLLEADDVLERGREASGGERLAG